MKTIEALAFYSSVFVFGKNYTMKHCCIFSCCVFKDVHMLSFII